MVYATANLKINIDIFCRIVAGLVFEGKVLANIWFFDLGYITTIKGLYFAQDMKLAYYCHVSSPQLPTKLSFPFTPLHFPRSPTYTKICAVIRSPNVPSSSSKQAES
jgi:hypothetical protein